MREALMAVMQPSVGLPEPDRAALELHAVTRADWNQLAEELSQSSSSTGRGLAYRIHQFLTNMPAAETERMQLRKQLHRHLQQQKEQEDAKPERSL